MLLSGKHAVEAFKHIVANVDQSALVLALKDE